jgi:hypothetical protein
MQPLLPGGYLGVPPEEVSTPGIKRQHFRPRFCSQRKNSHRPGRNTHSIRDSKFSLAGGGTRRYDLPCANCSSPVWTESAPGGPCSSSASRNVRLFGGSNPSRPDGKRAAGPGRWRTPRSRSQNARRRGQNRPATSASDARSPSHAWLGSPTWRVATPGRVPVFHLPQAVAPFFSAAIEVASGILLEVSE